MVGKRDKYMKTIEFLKTFSSPSQALNALFDTYGIKYNFHKIYGNLVQLKYDQVNSPMNNPITHECRGLILDIHNDWAIVAYPFKKFFSYGEYYADKVDFLHARYWEKIDGSMMFLYNYQDKWNVASSGLPDASGTLHHNDTMSMADLFWDTWSALGYELPTNTHVTYIFEMTSPHNQVLVPYTETDIQLIGARDLDSLAELDINLVSHNWKIVKSFPISSLDEALQISNSLNPMKQEGFVITDDSFNRVKMKSPQYVALSHLGLTPAEIAAKNLSMDKYDHALQSKWMLKIILVNECSEFLAYYPQYTDLYMSIKQNYDRLIDDTQVFYDKIKNIDNQLEFAKQAQQHPLSGILFQLRKQKLSSIKDGVKNMDANKLLKIIGKHEN